MLAKTIRNRQLSLASAQIICFCLLWDSVRERTRCDMMTQSLTGPLKILSTIDAVQRRYFKTGARNTYNQPALWTYPHEHRPCASRVCSLRKSPARSSSIPFTSKLTVHRWAAYLQHAHMDSLLDSGAANDYSTSVVLSLFLRTHRKKEAAH